MTERRSDVLQEVSGVAPHGGKPIVPHVYTFAGLTSTLGKVYRNPDEAVRNSVMNAAMMRRDPMIMGPLFIRQKATSLLSWSIVPEDEKDADQKDLASKVESILRRTPRMVEFLRSLTEAIWYGRYANQIAFGIDADSSGNTIRPIRQWTPVNGDKLVFRFDDETGDYDPDDVGLRVTAALRSDNIAVGNRDWAYTSEGSVVWFNRWERDRLVVHKHMIMDGDYDDSMTAGMIHGVGLRHFLYWTWLQKQETLAQLSEVVERTGMGFTLYFYPAGNTAAEAKVREVAESQPTNNQLLIPYDAANPDAYRVEQIPPNTAGITALTMLLDEYFGNWILRFILGQTLTMRADGTGLGSGLSDLQKDTFKQILKYDSNNLAETMTNGPVRSVQLFNFPSSRRHRLFFLFASDATIPAETLQAYMMAWNMGAKIKASDLMQAIGAGMPNEDDETLYNPGIASAIQQIQEAKEKGEAERAKAQQSQGLEQVYAQLLGRNRKYAKSETLPDQPDRGVPQLTVSTDEFGWHVSDPDSGLGGYVSDDGRIRYTHGDPLMAPEGMPQRFAEAVRGRLPKSVPSGIGVKGPEDVFATLKDRHGEAQHHDDAAWLLPDGSMVSRGAAASLDEQSWIHHDAHTAFDEHSPDLLKDKKDRPASAIRALQRFGAVPVQHHDDDAFHVELRNDLSSAQLERLKDVVGAGRPVAVSIIGSRKVPTGEGAKTKSIDDEVYYGEARDHESLDKLADAIRRRTVEKGDPTTEDVMSKMRSTSGHSAVDLLRAGRVIVPPQEGRDKPNMRDAYLYAMQFSGADKKRLTKNTSANNKKIAEALHDEALMALKHSSDAVGWYDRTYRKAGQAFEQAFPIIKQDPGKRAVFNALVAVTSNGLAVETNLDLGARIFQDYLENGDIDVDSYTYPGPSGPAIKGHVRLIKRMLDKLGEDGMAELLNSRMQSRQLKKRIQDIFGQDTKYSPGSGERATTEVNGSNIFGPKLGSFYGNLSGKFDTLTMDRWFMRTFRRITGDLADRNDNALPGQIERMLRTLGAKGKISGVIEEEDTPDSGDDDDDVVEDTPSKKKRIDLDAIEPAWSEGDTYYSAMRERGSDRPLFTLKRDDIVRDLLRFQETGRLNPKSAGMQFIRDREAWYNKSKFTDKSEANQAVHRAFVNLHALRDAPGGAAERERIRGVMEQARQMMDESGYDMSMADLQAVLWYAEKRLMPHLGIVNSRQLPDDYARQATLWVDHFLKENAGGDALEHGQPGRFRPRAGAASPRPKPPRGAGRSGGAGSVASGSVAAAPERNTLKAEDDRLQYTMGSDQISIVPEEEWSQWFRLGGKHSNGTGDADPDYLYHVTSEPAAKRIVASQSLRPGGSPGTRSIAGQGQYKPHSKGRVFLTESPGIDFWHSRVSDHLEALHDDPPPAAVVRVPRALVAANLKRDEVGSRDSTHDAWVHEGEVSGEPQRNALPLVAAAVRALPVVADAVGIGSAAMGMMGGDQPQRNAEGESAVAPETIKPSRSKALSSWYEGSKAGMDDKGQPSLWHHGTTRDFDQFDPDKAAPFSDFGGGMYFSSDPSDSRRNYASPKGPDVAARVALNADELINSDFRPSEHVDEEVMRPLWSRLRKMRAKGIGSTFDRFREKLQAGDLDDHDDIVPAFASLATVGNRTGRVISGHVRMRNPAHIGDSTKQNQTIVPFEGEAHPESVKEVMLHVRQEVRRALANRSSMTPESREQVLDRIFAGDQTPEEVLSNIEDELSEFSVPVPAAIDNARDNLQDLSFETSPMMRAARDAADDLGLDADAIAGSLAEEAGYSDLTMDQIDRWRRATGYEYMDDPDSGHSLAGEWFKGFIQNLGHDGIMLHNPSDRYRGMGLNPGTKHAIVWEPSSFKTHRRRHKGSYDEKDPRFDYEEPGEPQRNDRIEDLGDMSGGEPADADTSFDTESFDRPAGPDYDDQLTEPTIEPEKVVDGESDPAQETPEQTQDEPEAPEVTPKSDDPPKPPGDGVEAVEGEPPIQDDEANRRVESMRRLQTLHSIGQGGAQVGPYRLLPQGHVEYADHLAAVQAGDEDAKAQHQDTVDFGVWVDTRTGKRAYPQQVAEHIAAKPAEAHEEIARAHNEAVGAYRGLEKLAGSFGLGRDLRKISPERVSQVYQFAEESAAKLGLDLENVPIGDRHQMVSKFLDQKRQELVDVVGKAQGLGWIDDGVGIGEGGQQGQGALIDKGRAAMARIVDEAIQTGYKVDPERDVFAQIGDAMEHIQANPKPVPWMDKLGGPKVIMGGLLALMVLYGLTSALNKANRNQ